MTLDKYPYIRTLLPIQLDRTVGRGNVKTIMDVGAYQGVMCSRLAGRYRFAIVHAIEPYKELLEILTREAEAHKNMSIHQLAISGYDGEAALYVQPTGEGRESESNSLYLEFAGDKDAGLRKETVKCLTLSTFCDNNCIGDIDLLIINCEGGEYEIFGHGPSKEIIANSRVIYLSLHGKEFVFLTREYMQKKVDINRFLLDSGFRTVYGELLTDAKSLPTHHIRQVWIRE